MVPAWVGGRIRSTRLAQAGEHGRFQPSYTEIFPGCSVLCMVGLLGSIADIVLVIIVFYNDVLPSVFMVNIIQAADI